VEERVHIYLQKKTQPSLANADLVGVIQKMTTTTKCSARLFHDTGFICRVRQNNAFTSFLDVDLGVAASSTQRYHRIVLRILHVTKILLLAAGILTGSHTGFALIRGESMPTT
jgi:hypothetical protein